MKMASAPIPIRNAPAQKSLFSRKEGFTPAPAPQSMPVSRPPRSLGLDAAFLDHALPLVHFADHELAKVGGAFLDDLRAFARELFLHFSRILHLGDRLVQPRDDGRWRAGGRHDAPPVDRFIIRHAGFG